MRLIGSSCLTAFAVASCYVEPTAIVEQDEQWFDDQTFGHYSRPHRKIDLLFVIDDAPSMVDEQRNARAALPVLTDEILGNLVGDLPDLHVGFVSTTNGVSGGSSSLASEGWGDLHVAACASQFGLQGPFITDVADGSGGRKRNLTGDLGELMSCMAELGTNGSDFLMPLESAYRALQPDRNPGFYRPDAYLAIIFIGDDDDCSTDTAALFDDPTATLSSPLGPHTVFRCHEFGTVCDNDENPRAFGVRTGCQPRTSSPYMFDIERYVSFFRSLKPDPSMVITGTIAGEFNGTLEVGPDASNSTYPAIQASCVHASAARPAVRLTAFMAAFEHNAFTTICADDLKPAVATIGGLIAGAMTDAQCEDGVDNDGDGAIDGADPECVSPNDNDEAHF